MFPLQDPTNQSQIQQQMLQQYQAALAPQMQQSQQPAQQNPWDVTAILTALTGGGS